MIVVGPTGRRVVLPCVPGLSYPGRARAVTRAVFDDALRTAAVGCGRHRRRRSGRPSACGRRPELDGFVVDGRRSSGPTSSSAPTGPPATWLRAAGMVDGIAGPVGLRRALLSGPTGRPAGHHRCGNRPRWRAFPGYGWIFPGPGGTANVGLGVGTSTDRRSGSGAVRLLPGFLDHLVGLGLLAGAPAGSVTAATGRVAQDGHGRDHAGGGTGCCWWVTPPGW